MANAGTVTINLDANSVRLLRELKKAQTQTQRTAKRMQSSMTRSFKGITSAAKNAAAAFGIFAAARTIKGIAEAGISMQRLERGLRAATGSAEGAAQEMAFLREESDRLGLNFEQAASAFTKLSAAAKGTSLEGQNARDIFIAVSEASRVMGLSAEQTGGALTAIEQIISKGNVSAEELRGQLGERIPGAFQIAARAIGKTTQELDKMLKAGELTAQELLPALAKELRNTFGAEVAAAANDAQAAFNRMATAVFELKATFADSGLLDTLATMAGHLTTSARAVGDFLNTTLTERADQLRLDITKQEEKIRTRMFLGSRQNQELILAGMRNELDLTETRLAMEEKIAKQHEIQRSLILQIDTPAFEPREVDQSIYAKHFENIDRIHDRFVTSYATAEQEVAKLLADFSIVESMFPPEEQARIREAIKATLAVEELDADMFAPLERGSEAFFERMIEGADKSKDAVKALGLTFTSAFEDAIVEGQKLSDVMKGLLQDILRMAIRSTITAPLGNFFGGLFGGFKASGGPVKGGTSYVVGEQGPELFTPNMSGRIIPNGAGGGANINYTIDARGADEASVINRLVPLLEQTVQLTKNELRMEKSQGRF